MLNDKKRLLLTGSSGMLGSNILASAKVRDWMVFAPKSKDVDLRDYGAASEYISKVRPDIIIHSAAIVGGIMANVSEPVKFLDENVTINRNTIMAAYHNGIQNFINIGSTCMYPKNIEAPLEESMILTGRLEPTNEGYALAKIVAARLCQYLREEEPALNYKTLIPCNLYGPHDKFDEKRSHLVPAIINKIHRAKLQNATSVEIWGDGLARREFMYAADAADAILKAASDIQAIPGLMNIACGYDRTVREYYEVVSKVVGWEGSFEYNLSQPSGVRRKLASVDLQNEWGWEPKISIEQGISATYKYYLGELSRDV